MSEKYELSEFQKELEKAEHLFSMYWTRKELKNRLDKIERLNNIINELENELNRGYLDLFEYELVNGRELITNIKNYIQELKGSDK